MENILHETQVFEKSSFLELVNSNVHLFYFSNFWNNWTKISKTEISGELNTQFIYTFSFCPRLEDIMKFEKDDFCSLGHSGCLCCALRMRKHRRHKH